MQQLGVLVLLVVSLNGTPPETKVEGLGKPSASFCAVMVPNVESRIIMMEQEGAMLEIIPVHDSYALNAASTRFRNRLEGIQKFGFLVEEDTFERIHKNLEGKKASFVGGVFTDDGLKMRSFIVRDLDGNMVELFART